MPPNSLFLSRALWNCVDCKMQQGGRSLTGRSTTMRTNTPSSQTVLSSQLWFHQQNVRQDCGTKWQSCSAVVHLFQITALSWCKNDQDQSCPQQSEFQLYHHVLVKCQNLLYWFIVVVPEYFIILLARTRHLYTLMCILVMKLASPCSDANWSCQCWRLMN